MVDEITSNPNRSEPFVHEDRLPTKQIINWNDDIELTLNAIIKEIAGGGGSGDFVGPPSSVTDNLVSFADGTGKLGKDSGISAADIAASEATARKNIMLNAFRIAINGGLSLLNMVDGFVDEFEDETGIDAGASINESYDSVNKLYQNLGEADLVPTMTSNTTPSGVCSASSTTGEQPFRAFDDSNLTDWRSNNTDTGWLQYQFTSAQIALSISLQASISSFTPKDFTVQGSNTGAFAGEETILVTVINQTGWVTNEIRNFNFTTTGSFQYYRLDITANNGGGAIRVRELEFIGVGVPNMTLISNPQVAENIPTEAKIILFEEDVDAQILNTDLLAFASRDGGTTFTQMTLADDGDYETGRRILSGTADISGQPPGTNMRYKIETLNLKELKLHGVSLEWS